MAAAASAGGRRRARETEKALAQTRHRMAKQQGVLKVRTSKKFDDLSKDGLWIKESQVLTLLALAMMMREDRLESDAVQLVVDTAHRNQEKDRVRPPQHLKGAVAKKYIVMSVEKYVEYIRSAKTIDAAFQKYDKENDGYLTKKELAKMLQDYERKSNRSKMGLSKYLMVTEEDVDWVVQQSDSDQTGMINHAEYLPAIEAWEQLVQTKLDGSNQCIIL